MGLLDSILGAVAGGGAAHPQGGLGQVAAALLPVIMGMMQNREQGGLQGLLNQLQGGGLGDRTASWVGTGQNLPVSADEIVAALGQGQLARIASQSGLDSEQVGTGLSQLLPDLVDRLTPNGQVPDGASLEEGLAKLRGLFS